MDGLDYFDFDGSQISFEEWARKFMGPRHVGRTRVGRFTVSTVWLGMDHSFGFGPPPIIYETMVFHRRRPEEKGMQRYATFEQALAGHRLWVHRMRRPWRRVRELEIPGATTPGPS